MGAVDDLTTNARIAASLLDVLAASGDAAARARALHAAGVDATALRALSAWIQTDGLHAMFRAASAHPRLARRVGRELVAPAGLGLFFSYAGVATTEKAYRRCDQILARPARNDVYEALEIDRERAKIAFTPAGAAGRDPRPPGATPAYRDKLFCELRRGMLEGIPCVFGLLPARVRERECVDRGDARCVYEVHWSRAVRAGLVFGGLAGLAMGPALAFAAGAPPWAVALAAPALGLVSAAAGRSFDLARQLEAVAGPRRGHLALLDQADKALAEKMDELAKLGAMLDAGREEGGPDSPGDARHRSSQLPAARVSTPDVAALVREAARSARRALPESFDVELDFDDDISFAAACEPFQLEQVVEHLLKNACESMNGEGHARISLQSGAAGLEISVEDSGAGLEQEVVDRVFDPFVARPADAAAASASDFGLTVAYRIVTEHGGELRVQTSEGQGTRVTAVLPLR